MSIPFFSSLDLKPTPKPSPRPSPESGPNLKTQVGRDHVKNAILPFFFFSFWELSAEHHKLHHNFQRDESTKRGYTVFPAVLAFPNFICKKKNCVSDWHRCVLTEITHFREGRKNCTTGRAFPFFPAPFVLAEFRNVPAMLRAAAHCDWIVCHHCNNGRFP